MRQGVKIITNKTKAYQEAEKIAEFVSAKKAKDILILDLREISNICDYYVICSGDSPAQVKAIYDEANRKSKKGKIKIQHSETDMTCQWMLIDYGSTILHIFSEEARKFYDLEYLWKQAKVIRPFLNN